MLSSQLSLTKVISDSQLRQSISSSTSVDSQNSTSTATLAKSIKRVDEQIKTDEQAAAEIQ